MGGRFLYPLRSTATSCGDPPTGKINFINRVKVIASDDSSVGTSIVTMRHHTNSYRHVHAKYARGITTSPPNMPATLTIRPRHRASSPRSVLGTPHNGDSASPNNSALVDRDDDSHDLSLSSQSMPPPITGTVQFFNLSSNVKQGSPVPVANGQVAGYDQFSAAPISEFKRLTAVTLTTPAHLALSRYR